MFAKNMQGGGARVRCTGWAWADDHGAAVGWQAAVACGLASTAFGADLAPLVSGDEPFVTTEHRITTPRGALAYEAVAGRMPIRNAETGQERISSAYIAKQPPGAKP